MADALVRLKVESKEYDNKIRRAAEGLQHFEQECRRVGGTLEIVEKDELDFVRALGQMQTVATNSRQKMMEFTNAINDLSIQYKGLTAAEKQSPYGQALAESISQLKVRAGELKDRIADTNAELRNLASDTAFTDGVGMMTSTIGACASAMAAWGGQSKTMDEMIKSLAKIQTTVTAVNALTKAFQKQNLVLLKNPYVAAAAGAALLLATLTKLAKKQLELTAIEKDLKEIQSKGNENAAKEVTRIEQLNTILHDNTSTLEERRNALQNIQALVPEYHGALTDEGNLINDNTSALSDYVNELKRAALAQAAFDRMVEIQKNKLNEELALQKAQEKLAQAKATNAAVGVNASYIGGSITGATASSIYSAGASNAVALAQSEVDKRTATIASYDNEINALQGFVTATDLATNAITGSKTGGASKSGKGLKLADVATMPEAGSIADLEAQAALVRNSMSGATSAAEYAQMDAVLQSILDKIRAITGEGAKMDEVFSEPAEGTLPYLRQQLKEAMDCLEECVIGSEAWAEGLEKVKEAQKNVNDAQKQISGSSQSAESTAQGTVDAWQNAAIALQAAASAMNAIDDPAAKVAGTLAQAVASIMLGFAQAAASPATGAAGVFGWIAATLSGLATAISVVSTIKSVTAGSYAEGGIIPGNSLSGDNLIANVNSGELILNRAQQASIAAQLQQAPLRGMQIYGTSRISGGDILIALDNTNRARGGSRGTYSYSK